MGSRPSIFTLPPGAPFLDTLAAAILDGRLPGGGPAPSPLELTDLTLYLPNRRACRAMTQAFLEASPSQALLMPRILPLGDEDETLLLMPEDGEEQPEAREGLAPPIGVLARRMALTRFIMAWGENLKARTGERPMFAATPAASSELALEFMRLLDEAQSENIDLTRLDDLAPERFATHWAETRDFLAIVADAWPDYLARVGVADPVARRNALMAATAAKLTTGHPPVIIAGSTGSIPATAALMRAVLDMPNGAVVLPGLDTALDDANWEAIGREHPEHPQFGLNRLLVRLGIARGEVEVLPGASGESAATVRRAVLRETLRPVPDAQALAAIDAGGIRDAFKSVSLIAAPASHDEASAIALILRSVAETPGKTASLVTPDRTLARRVAVMLKAWDITIEDFGGEPLRRTPQGAFMELIAAAVEPDAAVPILSLLKHPAMRLGLDPGAARERAEMLECLVFRLPGVKPSLETLVRLTKRAPGGRLHPAARRFTPEQRRDLVDLAERLHEAFMPMLSLKKPAPLLTFAAAHLAVAEALADAEFWTGAAGQRMRRVMEQFAEDVPGPILTAADYPALYRTLTRRETVTHGSADGRLAIWGPREARLQRRDVLILAGLNEGTWPEAADPGPWLNRTMRVELGFEPPERRLGQAAHDFTEAFGCRELYLTRAAKVDGAPALASRWLMRLTALLDGLKMGDVLEPDRPWLEWARQPRPVNAASRAKPSRPKPRPPLTARPRKLSVSDVETFIANPYAIFAKHILKLEPLPDLAAEPGASERGQLIHAALAEFANRHPVHLPDDPAAVLMAIADDILAREVDHIAARAFWRPRLARFADWFAATEPQRREKGVTVLSEVPGEVTFEAPAGPFTLKARADRIDAGQDGMLTIYDYKTGSIPANAQVTALRAPQLPLEAYIAAEGGFTGLSTAETANLVYISAKGGDPAGEERAVEGRDIMELAAAARDGLKALVARFDDPATPYEAKRRAGFEASYRYDDYAHLARVLEWAEAAEE